MKHCNCKNNCNCNDNELLKLIAIDIAKLKNIIDDILDSDRKVYWNSIINKPDVFPPEFHQHIIEDIIGLNDLVLEVNNKVDKVTGKSLVENSLIEKLEEDYTKAQIDQKFNDIERDVLGKVTTSQTLVQLNALPDGIYEAQTEGVYANGITAKSGYTTKFQKVGTTWTLFSEVKLPTPTADALITEGDTRPVSGDTTNKALNVGVLKEVPQGWIAQTFTTTSSSGYIYYDTRSFVSDKNLLKDVNIKFRIVANVGTIDLVAISMSGVILHSETKTGFSALTNIVKFNDLSSVNEPFYVGIRQLSGGGVIALKPAAVPGYSMWKPVDSGSFTPVAYDLGYSINIYDGGIRGEIKQIKSLITSDINKIQEDLIKNGHVKLPAGEVVINSTIDVPSGSTLEGVFGKTILKAGASLGANPIIRILDKTDVSVGNIVLKGSLSNYVVGPNGILPGVNIINTNQEGLDNLYKGNEVGLHYERSERVHLFGIQFLNLNGVGLIGDYVGKSYTYGATIDTLWFFNCYKGIETRNEHEFSRYSNIMISACQIGLECASGNLDIHATITQCRLGLVIKAGHNNAHGIFYGMIKHCSLQGLLIDSVTNGQLFGSLQMQYANLCIQNSKGVLIPALFFTNGRIECTGNSEGTGQNEISVLWKGSGTTVVNSGNLIIERTKDWNLLPS